MTAKRIEDNEKVTLKLEGRVSHMEGDLGEIKQGMKLLLQRDASRPDPVKASHMITTVATVLAIVGVLTGFIQWQIRASTSHEALKSTLQITRLRLEIEKRHSGRRMAALRPGRYGGQK